MANLAQKDHLTLPKLLPILPFAPLPLLLRAISRVSLRTSLMWAGVRGTDKKHPVATAIFAIFSTFATFVLPLSPPMPLLPLNLPLSLATDDRRLKTSQLAILAAADPLPELP